MKKLLLGGVALVMLSGAAMAQGKCNAACQIADLRPGELRDVLTELNNEDQRLVDGRFDAATGTLYLYTQDMTAGADKDISRREVVVKGFEGMRGKDGADGRDGSDGVDGAPGRDGVDGVDGRDGLDGRDGVDGRDGIDGSDGRDGVDGVDGTDGADGRDGADGVDGVDGRDGVDGKDGRDADTARIYDVMAADRAMGVLQTRTPDEGQWTGTFGLSGLEGDLTGVGLGARYGISETADMWGTVGVSKGGAVAWGVGLAWDF